MADAAYITTSQSPLRRRMERAVERLLAAMDAMDGDPDFEPSLGSLGSSIALQSQTSWAFGGDQGEREAVCEDEGAQCEDEGHDSDTEQDYADYG